MPWLIPGEQPELPFQRAATSFLAALAIETAADTLRGQLLRHLIQCGPRGATDEEMQLGLPMAASTQRPRRRELFLGKLVLDSGFTRKTRSGRSAIVWMAQGGMA